MSFNTTYGGHDDYVQQLGDRPMIDNGFSKTSDFKAVFDRFGHEFKIWFNQTFVAAINNYCQEKLGSSNKLNGAYITDHTITSTQISNSANITGSQLSPSANIAGTQLATGAAAGNLADGDVHYAKLNSDAKSTVVRSGITIDKSDWNGGTSVSVTVSGVSAADNIIVSPSTPQQYEGTTYFETWRDYGIHCVSQSDNILNFACDATPNKSVRFNVLVVR